MATGCNTGAEPTTIAQAGTTAPPGPVRAPPSTSTTVGPEEVSTSLSASETTAADTTATTFPRQGGGSSFEEIEGPYLLGPDAAIAAGFDRLVIITNSIITLRDKQGGLIASMPSAQFFAPADVPDYITREGQVTDPHTMFDPGSGRFFVVEDGGLVGPICNPKPCQAYQLLAISKNSRPQTLDSDDWYFYGFDRTVDVTPEGTTQTNNGGDRDYLAVNEEAVVITSIDYDFDDGSAQGANIRILDKTPLINGQPPPSWTDIPGVTDPLSGQTRLLFPIPTLDGSGRFFFVSRSFVTCLTVVVWSLDDPLGSPTLSSQTVAGVEPPEGCEAGVVDAVQPGEVPPIRTDADLSSGALASGSLWTAATVTVDYPSGQVTGIEWVQIDVSSWPEPPSLVQASVFSQEGVYRWLPAVMVDPSQNLAMVYAQTTKDEFPSLYVVQRWADDPPNQLRDGILLKAGVTSTSFFPRMTPSGVRTVYGDYFGTSLDPADGSVWVVGEYAKADSTVGMWAANIVFP